MNRRLKLIVGTLLITVMGISFTGCGSSDESGEAGSGNVTISVSGSTSVGPLMEKLAEAYEDQNENVSIEIQQIGSSGGITNSINGVSEIGMSSRALKDEEAEQVTGTAIAYDGIALVVNNENTVTELTFDQVTDIYTGKITNWSEVGGGDQPIVVISREEGSGTRDAFQELVGYTSEELVADASIGDGNGNVKANVQSNTNAIGFISFEYLDGSVTELMIDGYSPNPENVKEDLYSISRPFNITTKEENLTEEGQMFIDFILGAEGQQIVTESGLISIE